MPDEVNLLDGFPTLPKGYHWKVSYRSSLVPRVKVEIKGRFFSHEDRVVAVDSPEHLRKVAFEYAQACYQEFMDRRRVDQYYVAASDMQDLLNAPYSAGTDVGTNG
ncbi:hypothetical protein JRC04_05385 [Mycolicibacterium sp. S2-37]|uniref:hypothetical protein n=1 Tax=Mycolicibacterium sp. S2-37 TaxID=2810297 RepID=UPI001A94B9CA|nr:hypothetical protein [Mycolicibacterium sp. S2-37]MBO0676888.1 hypothetical protein [Mycolicibacterium sp. S2-37]